MSNASEQYEVKPEHVAELARIEHERMKGKSRVKEFANLLEPDLYFGNIEENVYRLNEIHRRDVDRADWQLMVFGRHVPVWDLQQAIRSYIKRVERFYNVKGYTPHQGKRECARRIRQMSK
jgi:hypothetical protein